MQILILYRYVIMPQCDLTRHHPPFPFSLSSSLLCFSRRLTHNLS